jgi:hypothetical protein
VVFLQYFDGWKADKLSNHSEIDGVESLIHNQSLEEKYEQQERVFHRDIQTRENNVWYIVYMTSQMNRDVTECFRLLIWIELLTKHNVIKNSIQVILHT